jgi:hypothetical protein
LVWKAVAWPIACQNCVIPNCSYYRTPGTEKRLDKVVDGDQVAYGEGSAVEQGTFWRMAASSPTWLS